MKKGRISQTEREAIWAVSDKTPEELSEIFGRPVSTIKKVVSEKPEVQAEVQAEVQETQQRGDKTFKKSIIQKTTVQERKGVAAMTQAASERTSDLRQTLRRKLKDDNVVTQIYQDRNE